MRTCQLVALLEAGQCQARMSETIRAYLRAFTCRGVSIAFTKDGRWPLRSTHHGGRYIEERLHAPRPGVLRDIRLPRLAGGQEERVEGELAQEGDVEGRCHALWARTCGWKDLARRAAAGAEEARHVLDDADDREPNLY